MQTGLASNLYLSLLFFPRQPIMKGVNLSQASILSVLVPCLVLANPLPAPDVSAKRDLTGVVCSGNVVVDFNGADACAYYLRSLGKNQCQVATGASPAAQSSQVCHSSDVSISMVLNPATLSDYLPNASMYCGKSEWHDPAHASTDALSNSCRLHLEHQQHLHLQRRLRIARRIPIRQLCRYHRLRRLQHHQRRAADHGRVRMMAFLSVLLP